MTQPLGPLQTGRIARDLLCDAIRAMGLDPEDTYLMVIKPDLIQVRTYLRNENGHIYMDGGEPASRIDVIKVGLR